MLFQGCMPADIFKDVFPLCVDIFISVTSSGFQKVPHMIVLTKWNACGEEFGSKEFADSQATSSAISTNQSTIFWRTQMFIAASAQLAVVQR